MRQAILFMHATPAGTLIENDDGYIFNYYPEYIGEPVSLTLPLSPKPYHFEHFPAFLDGLLPEGPQLEALLRLAKLDRNDYLGQLIRVGEDLVGAITAKEAT